MTGDDPAGWAEQRQRSIAAHEEALRRRRAAEAEQARELLADFAREATRRGLRTTRLAARPYSGRGTYRTDREGWYLNAEHTLAVGTGGEYYVLTVPASLRARLTGVSIEPEEPRLIIGEGARDGESMPLQTLLRMRLEAGDDWP